MPAPAAPSENSRRDWQVFSLRITKELRERLLQAAALEAGGRRPQVSRFARQAIAFAVTQALKE